MFKFLKNKKGFTLVELMIVVVIMAILVAVAVPIFSAVTENARVKTCLANRREIVAQMNQFTMGAITGSEIVSAMSFEITSDGDKATITESKLVNITKADINNLFQELPYCPGSGTYTVTVTPSPNINTSPTIKAYCNGGQDGAGEHGETVPTT